MRFGKYEFSLSRNKTSAAFADTKKSVGRMGSEVLLASDSIIRAMGIPEYNPDDLIRNRGYQVYRKMMLDEQVKAVTRFRRDSVTSRDFSFEAPLELSEKEQEFRKDLFSHIIKAMPGSFKSKLDMVMSALYNGYSITEKTLELIPYQNKQWFGIKTLRKKPYYSFYFIMDAFGAVESITQNLGAQEIKVDPSKIIHHVQNADEHEYYGQSELREAYRAYYYKDIAIKLHGLYLERMAGGFVWLDPGESNVAPNSPDWANLQEVLSSINTKTSMIVPKGSTLNVEFPGDTDAFEKAVAGHDKAIAKCLLTPNLLGLSEQGNVGSNAQSQTQLEAFLWILDSEAKALEETINEQLFKQLGDLNFGDGLYPVFKFKPLSGTQIERIVNQWKGLVGVGAVKTTQADVEHLRDMLSFPQLQDDDADKEAEMVDPQSALTGIQTQSLKTILLDVTNRLLTPETAVMVINESFAISEERAKQLVDSVEIKEEQDIVAPGEEVPADDEANVDTGPNADPSSDGEDDKDTNKDGEAPVDETIAGRATTKIETQMAKRKKRTNYNRIAETADSAVDKFTKSISNVLAEGMEPIIAGVNTMNMASKEAPRQIKQIRLDSKTKKRLKTLTNQALRAGWKLGVDEAKNELGRVSVDAFNKSKSIVFERLEDVAASYFEERSFTMSGNLTHDAQAIVKNILSNGIKNNKTNAELIEEIYQTFASKGLMSKEDVEQALGEAVGVEHPDARLKTVLNTNIFNAINEARYSYFTDPALDGFVEAFEYSAVMDSRTTQICRHLDGQVHAAEGGVWSGEHRPPNHFNCRSILIPVVEGDPWSEDDPPEIQPQQGFTK